MRPIQHACVQCDSSAGEDRRHPCQRAEPQRVADRCRPTLRPQEQPKEQQLVAKDVPRNRSAPSRSLVQSWSPISSQAVMASHLVGCVNAVARVRKSRMSSSRCPRTTASGKQRWKAAGTCT